MSKALLIAGGILNALFAVFHFALPSLAQWQNTLSTISTDSHANRGDKKEYGYLWWTDPQGKWYAALGRDGEHIFVYPAENLVVVFTAGLLYTNDADLIPLQELLDQYILPAVKSGRPLPANPNSLARLKAGIQALAQPQRTAPPPLPAIAGEISGKTYMLGDNPFGCHTLAFAFQDSADEAKVTVDGTQMAVGLDNVYRTIGGADSTFPEELRGCWENQDTFVVEVIVLGQMMQPTSRIRFPGTSSTSLSWISYPGTKPRYKAR